MLTAFVLLLSAAVLLYLLFLAWPRCSLRCHALAPGARAAPLAGTACLKEGFASRKVPEQLDTIVIGSGAAGLTAAALLAKRGQRVLVLEQHDVAGGCTHTFEERGFEFDVGLHYVGDILGVLLNAVTSGVIEWAPTGRLVDEVYFGDDVVPILSPKAAFLAELRRRFPSEGAALHSYSWRVPGSKRRCCPAHFTRSSFCFAVSFGASANTSVALKARLTRTAPLHPIATFSRTSRS